MTILAETISVSGTWQLMLHINLGNGGSHFQYRSIEHPRLLLTKSRKDRRSKMVLTFHVGDGSFDALEAAVKAMNQEDDDRAWEAADPARRDVA